MGNQKQKWTQEEEEALLKGVAKHGPGKWKNILRDVDFNPLLSSRSNIDLKDKWRNLSVCSTGQGSRDKSKTVKVNPFVDAPSTTIPASPASAPAAPSYPAPRNTPVDINPAPRNTPVDINPAPRNTPVDINPAPQNTPVDINPAPQNTPVDINPAPQNTPLDIGVYDPSNSALDGENAPRYNRMIFEALSSLKDANGSDTCAIFGFIEQRHELTPNLRSILSSRLRRLVSQGKLKKAQNCYKIKKDNLGTKAPIPKPREVRSRPSLTSGPASGDTAEEAAITAAYKVAEAENKAFVAAEAVKEAEKVTRMADDSESMLRLVREIFEQCLRGEIIVFE